MKKSSKQIEELRAKLKSKENKLWSELDHEAGDLEKRLTLALKAAGVIGGSVLAGYIVYRLIAGEGSSQSSKKSKKKSLPIATKISQSMLSILFKSIIPVAIDKIQNKIQSNNTDESTSENRRG